MFFRVFIITFLFTISSLSWATTYKKGSLECSNFEADKARFEAQPEHPVYEANYAICLITQGKDHEGLVRLRFLSEEKDLIWAAYLVALYEKSGGNFIYGVVSSNLNPAIQAVSRVLVLIDFKGSQYPELERDFVVERSYQIELRSNYFFVFLHFYKFYVGALSLYNQTLLNSSNYKGDRDLTIYPEYHATLDSLKKTMELASRCLSLPKKDHFQSLFYQTVRQACQSLKDAAFELLPMERKRLELLQACKNKLPDCPEHDEHEAKMLDTFDTTMDRIDELFDAYNSR